MSQKYTKVDFSINGAIILYSKYKCGSNKIEVVEKEIWPDCTAYHCRYKGYDFTIYHYKSGDVEIAYDNLSEEAERTLAQLDFIFYYDDVQRELKRE